MQNINDLFKEKNMIMESLSYEYFDPLDYLYEAANIILEEDNQNNNKPNENHNKDNDSLKLNDKRFDFKKAISNMIRTMIEWFTRLKNAMINFFKGFKNVNHKKMMKEIFTDKTKHDKKVKIFDYVSLKKGNNIVNGYLKDMGNILVRMLDSGEPSLEYYKNQISNVLKIKTFAASELGAIVRGAYIRNNQKIKIRIGQLNEQIMSSYLLHAQESVNDIEQWKNSLRMVIQDVQNQLYRDFNSGKFGEKILRQFESVLRMHLSTSEKICVCSMKTIKKAYMDFSKILTKGNGTMSNIENKEDNQNKLENGGNNEK